MSFVLFDILVPWQKRIVFAAVSGFHNIAKMVHNNIKYTISQNLDYNSLFMLNKTSPYGMLNKVDAVSFLRWQLHNFISL